MDRNNGNNRKIKQRNESLSARRAWIEIDSAVESASGTLVALRKESVDRNLIISLPSCGRIVALRKESVDRIFKVTILTIAIHKSLSARRAWIEM